MIAIKRRTIYCLKTTRWIIQANQLLENKPESKDTLLGNQFPWIWGSGWKSTWNIVKNIEQNDLKSLMKNAYFNDNIMDFYIKYLNNIINKPKKSRVNLTPQNHREWSPVQGKRLIIL